MKIQTLFKYAKFIISHFRRLSVLAIALGGLSACASISGLLHQTESPLPIDAVHSRAGRIESSRAFETIDKLYVTGSMEQSLAHSLHRAAHIDVQLLDKSGRAISEKEEKIDSSDIGSGMLGDRRYSYVVSFPLAEAREASRIRVTYHADTH